MCPVAGGNSISSFLKKVGVVDESSESSELSHWTRQWLETKDAAVIIALLHRSCRFVGEMVHELRIPRSTRELFEIANGVYSMEWTTQAQVDRRRGWLQSAGMITENEDGKLIVTSGGCRLLEVIDIYSPQSLEVQPESFTAAPPLELLETTGQLKVDRTDTTSSLETELIDSSTDANHPDRFEQAVTAAFDLLGFESKWLGGSGKTDVLVDAPIGADRSYRLIIDCKTTASGSVSDQQIDWITLSEHKKKHDADYVAVVAPNPSGKRMHERAHAQNVTLISVESLVALCAQHASAPLGLDDYEQLFKTAGLADVAALSEDAEEWITTAALARRVIVAIRHRSRRVGPLTARDLLLVFDSESSSSESLALTEATLDDLLKTLSSPLIGILTGTAEQGYLVRMSDEVGMQRFKALAATWIFSDGA